MALIIRMKHQGQWIAELELVSGKTYIGGRGTPADLPMEGYPGISRQHFQIIEEGGFWTIRKSSRYGVIIHEGVEAESVELKPQLAFSIPPYEFYVSETVREIQSAEEEISPEKNPAVSMEHFDLAQTDPNALAQSHHQGVADHKALVSVVSSPPLEPKEAELFGDSTGDENTSPGLQMVVPELRVTNQESGKTSKHELLGDVYVIGRDKSCDIQVRTSQISRRQFEISRSQNQIFVTDLGSVNGTKLNGEKLVANKPTPLGPGDEISAAQYLFVVELVDPGFTKNVKALALQEASGQPGNFTEQSEFFNPGEPEVVKVSTQGSRKRRKKNNRRLFIYGGILVLLYFIFVGGGKPKNKPAPGPESKVEQKDMASNDPKPKAFEALADEKKKEVIQKLALAKQLYQEGRFELAINEINAIHALVPFYQDSREVLGFAQSGRKNLEEIQEIEARKRREHESRVRIESQVAECRAKIKPTSSASEVQACLQPVLELDPENADAQVMISTAQSYEEKITAQAIGRQQKQEASGRAKKKLAQARQLAGKEQYGEALKVYSGFLKMGEAPAADKKEAQREVASIQQKLELQKKSVAVDAEKFIKNNQYKEAVTAFDQALKRYPAEPSFEEGKAKAMAELRKQVKGVYEDAILEESVGKVEAAKELWRKIIDVDVRSGEYYKKSKTKLKQYGYEAP